MRGNRIEEVDNEVIFYSALYSPRQPVQVLACHISATSLCHHISQLDSPRILVIDLSSDNLEFIKKNQVVIGIGMLILI